MKDLVPLATLRRLKSQPMSGLPLSLRELTGNTPESTLNLSLKLLRQPSPTCGSRPMRTPNSTVRGKRKNMLLRGVSYPRARPVDWAKLVDTKCLLANLKWLEESTNRLCLRWHFLPLIKINFWAALPKKKPNKKKFKLRKWDKDPWISSTKLRLLTLPVLADFCKALLAVLDRASDRLWSHMKSEN